MEYAIRLHTILLYILLLHTTIHVVFLAFKLATSNFILLLIIQGKAFPITTLMIFIRVVCHPFHFKAPSQKQIKEWADKTVAHGKHSGSWKPKIQHIRSQAVAYSGLKHD